MTGVLVPEHVAAEIMARVRLLGIGVGALLGGMLVLWLLWEWAGGAG